jgi:anti-sigma B factor antagonist
MELTTVTIDGVHVVTIHLTQLDAGNVDDFKQSIAPTLEEAKKMVLDFKKVQFVDSSGCGAILSCLKHLTQAGGDLALCEVNPPVRTVFELIRLHRICHIVNTREDAVKVLK